MKDANRLTYGRTSVYNLNYHIIWGTKYRNKVLNGNVEAEFRKIVADVAEQYGFEVAHLKIDKDDYIHVLVSAPPKLSVTNIVRWLKGITARQMFARCPELKTEFWQQQNRHLWTRSYYVQSVGTLNQEAVAKYIDDQRRKEQ